MKRNLVLAGIALGIATMLTGLVTSCNSGKKLEGKAIQGISVGKFNTTFKRLPLKLLTIDEIKAKWPPKPGEAAKMPGGSAVDKSVPAVYIDHGKYLPDKSKTSAVLAGKIGDTAATGLKIVANDGDVGGVFATGEGSDYTVSDADIELSGNVDGLGGRTSGAAVDDHATMILRNVKIVANGSGRNTISATNYSTLKVYDSTLIGHDAPFDPKARPTNVTKALEINGNSRTTITMTNSYTYLYNSTITADGWGALSTDAGGKFVYLQANNCKVRTIKSGYGAYADLLCHDTFNNCDFNTASMAIIIAGVGDATFNHTKATCGTYFALMHCVTGSPTEVGTLTVNGGEIACKGPAVIVKSHNADISFNGVKLTTASGVLIKTVVNQDPHTTPTDGKTVYGVHATFKDMSVAGDIIHEDTDRILSVDLKSTSLRGAITDAYLTMDAGSKWTATGNSTVTFVGSIPSGQIDAPKGVTITATVSAPGGTFELPSGGTLILKGV